MMNLLCPVFLVNDPKAESRHFIVQCGIHEFYCLLTLMLTTIYLCSDFSYKNVDT